MSVQSDEDDEYLAMVEGQRARALATIERVKALIAPEAQMAQVLTLGSERYFCESDLRAALEPTPS
jgi:hypothetical protein